MIFQPMFKIFNKISLMLSCLFIIFTSHSFAQMNGIYTVGKTTNDSFSTISEAIDSLKSQGISGNTIIRIRGGIYNEQLNIPLIAGLAQYSLSFEPYDTAKPELRFASSSPADNYIIKIISSRNLNIKNLIFRAIGQHYGRIVVLNGNCKNIEFRQNTFYGVKSGNTSANYTIFYSSADTLSGLITDSNFFYEGSAGISIIAGGKPADSIYITNNRFINQFSAAIEAEMQNGIVISGNSIQTNSYHNQFIGIELSGSTGKNRITGNKIYHKTNGFSILLNRVNSAKGNESLVANNFTHAGGNAAAIGIFIETCSFINVYHNNIFISSLTLSSAGRCINIQNSAGYCGNLGIFNNIMVNKGMGFGLITFTTDTISSDYNCYYTNGYIGYWNGYLSNNLSTWSFYSRQDTHSLIKDPQFLNENDLHILEKQLIGKGKYFTEVSMDIDNEMRDTIACTYGADELLVYQIDLAVIELNPAFLLCKGDSTVVWARIRNTGTDTIHHVITLLKINGILKDSIHHLITLIPESESIINTGYVFFATDQNYRLSVSLMYAGGLTDQNLKNNMMEKNFKPALKDTFTVDINGNGNYRSISDALADIQERGICKSLTILIKPGIYTEQLNFDSVAGLIYPNKLNIIGLKSLTDSVVVRFGAVNWYANYVVRIGISNLVLRNICFIADGNVYGKIIEISGINNNLEFDSILFYGEKVSNSSTEFAIIWCMGDNFKDTNLVIRNCKFIDGSYGIYLAGYDNQHQSSTCLIYNNLFLNQFGYGIYALYFRKLELVKNIIRTQNSANYYSGIYTYYCNDIKKIEQNQIIMHSGRSGIYLITSSSTPAIKCLVSNNFIDMQGNESNARCLMLDNSSYFNIYHNTFRQGNQYYAGNVIDLSSSTSNTEIKNNILLNTGGSMLINAASNLNNVSNYNILFTIGSNFGNWNGVRTSFSDWVNASGQDKNSKNINPVFRSEDDLHCIDFECDSAGVPLTTVLYDIDDEPRNPTHPDIGADEFLLKNFDVALNGFPSFSIKGCDGQRILNINIQNRGKVPLDSLIVNWEINQKLNSSKYYFNQLKYLQSVNLSLGNYYFNADSLYYITAQAKFPNGQIDEDSTNNNIELTNLNLLATPGNIQVRTDTVCIGESAILKAFSPRADRYFWYENPADGNIIGFDSVFKTSSLKRSATFYVSAVSEMKPDSLKIPFTSNVSNLTNGNMFDIITSNNSIWIDSMDVHTQYSNYYTFLIYFKKGTSVGFQNDSLAWEQHDSVTVWASGFGKPTRIPLKHSIYLSPHDTFGFYITTYQVGFLNYTPGTSNINGTHFRITNSIALDYLFDAKYSSPAIWNGNIYYSSGPYCFTQPEAVKVYVREKINTQLPSDTSLCVGSSLFLDGGDDRSAIYKWTLLPSGNIIANTDTLTIYQSGNYRLEVTDICGNTTSDTIKITYAIPPEAKFVINDDEQCLSGNKFIFDNKSFSLIDSIYFLWNFGDSNFSTQKNTTHEYTEAGKYTVSLIAKTTKGCTDSFFRTVRVFPMPEAAFQLTDDSMCLNQHELKTINTSFCDSCIFYSFWQFGDGDTSTLFEPVHHYQSSGKYTVLLTVTSGNGCTDTYSSSVLILPHPEVNLGNDTIICAGKSILLFAGFGYEKYLWSNDSTDPVIRIDSAGTGVGTKLVWVKVSHKGCETTDTILITFKICSGMSDISNSNPILIPNPGTNYLIIYIPLLNTPEEYRYEIINLHGKAICTGAIITPLTKIETNHLPSGIYLIRISKGYEHQTYRWIKQ